MAGISISILSGDNGILKQAVIARDKTRGAEVQESVKLAAINNTSTDYLGGTKQTRAEVIDQLHADGKLTNSEVATLEENDVITIGGITIDFSVIGSASNNSEDLAKLKQYFEEKSLMTLLESRDVPVFKNLDPIMDASTSIVVSGATGPNSIVIKYIDNYYRLVINDTTNYIVLEVNEITGRDVTYSLVVSGSVVVLQTSLGLESFFDNIISEYNPKMIVEGNEINLTPYINKLYDIYDVIILTGWELLEYDGKTATISLTIYGQTITWTGTI